MTIAESTTDESAAAREMMRVVYHADLSGAHPGEDYWLRAAGRDYQLVPHTPASLAAAQAEAPILAKYPGHAPTHYTDVAVLLPRDCVVRVHLAHTTKTLGRAWATGVGHVAIWCPPPGAELDDDSPGASHHHNEPITWTTTAETLIFHHPDLMTKDPAVAAIVKGYYKDKNIASQVGELANYMMGLGPSSLTKGIGWAWENPFTPEANTTTGITGKPNYLLTPAPSVVAQAATVATSMMIATKNDLQLQNEKWRVQPGTAVQIAQPLPETPDSAKAVDDWSVASANSDPVDGLLTQVEVVSAASQQVSITLSNYYIRYLGIFISFSDADGNLMMLSDWSNYIDLSEEASVVNDLFPVAVNSQGQTGICYVGHVPPILTVFGIPISSEPGQLTVTVTFPSSAVSMRVYGSGLGTGANPYKNQPIVGGILTGLVSLAVPSLMLATGTAMKFSSGLQSIVESTIKNVEENPLLLRAIGLIAAGAVGESIHTCIDGNTNFQTFETIGEALFDKAFEKWMAYVVSLDAAEQVEDEIPFIGWAMIAINILAGVAQITETIVEVCESPWNITNDISASITSTVNLSPDPRHGVFPSGPPPELCTYQINMIFKKQTRPTVSSGQVTVLQPPGPTLTFQFPNNTLGSGEVKFEAEYYVGQWLAAKATSGWMANNAINTETVSLTFVEMPAKLTAKSVYRHAQILTYSNGSYGWSTTSEAPPYVQSNTEDTGNNISVWAGLDLNQRAQSLGYAWKAAGMGILECGSQTAGQLYAMQNVDIPGGQSGLAKFPSCGFHAPSGLLYDHYPPKFQMIYDLDSKIWTWSIGPNGKPLPDPSDAPLGNFYIDPRKRQTALSQGGGWHLRQVVLDDTTPFDMAADQPSWGRFPVSPDALALHPSGNVVAVNTAIGKLFVLKVPEAGTADNQALVARSFGGPATNTTRPGLTFNPIGVACSYDGTIFVLENNRTGNAVVARIQAFDIHGNPVGRFADFSDDPQPLATPSPFLYLADAAQLTVLDLACVGDQAMTYLYVLGYINEGSNISASDYRMAVYEVGHQPMPYQAAAQPKSSLVPTGPLFTTSGVAAASIAVDMWHSLYTLNYQMTTDGEGNLAGPNDSGTGPHGRTVPSVSEWLVPQS